MLVLDHQMVFQSNPNTTLLYKQHLQMQNEDAYKHYMINEALQIDGFLRVCWCFESQLLYVNSIEVGYTKSN